MNALQQEKFITKLKIIKLTINHTINKVDYLKNIDLWTKEVDSGEKTLNNPKDFFKFQHEKINNIKNADLLVNELLNSLIKNEINDESKLEQQIELINKALKDCAKIHAQINEKFKEFDKEIKEIDEKIKKLSPEKGNLHKLFNKIENMRQKFFDSSESTPKVKK